MRVEYFLLCKKKYKGDGIFGSLFKNSIFSKGQRYKITKETITLATSSNPYSTTLTSNPYPYITSTTSTTSTSFSWNYYSINGLPVTASFISEFFYTLKEERCLKLKKLDKLL